MACYNPYYDYLVAFECLKSLWWPYDAPIQIINVHLIHNRNPATFLIIVGGSLHDSCAAVSGIKLDITAGPTYFRTDNDTDKNSDTDRRGSSFWQGWSTPCSTSLLRCALRSMKWNKPKTRVAPVDSQPRKVHVCARVEISSATANDMWCTRLSHIRCVCLLSL